MEHSEKLATKPKFTITRKKVYVNNHDPLCRGLYQRYTDVENCASCDLIAAVREDDRLRYDTNIGKLDAAFKEGYGFAKEESVSMLSDYLRGVPSIPAVHVNMMMRVIRNEIQ